MVPAVFFGAVASGGVACDPGGHRGALPPRAIAKAVPQHRQAEARVAGEVAGYKMNTRTAVLASKSL